MDICSQMFDLCEQCQSEVEENEVISYLKEHTEKYKQPVVWKMVKQLPRNYMGKLERSKVKEMFYDCSQ